MSVDRLWSSSCPGLEGTDESREFTVGAARVWASAWGGRRIDAFKLWCYRRLLRVAWTARRSNQSILKGINPEYSLEGRC